MAKKSKIAQAESRIILRSQINFASYNPRSISEYARKKLKANLKEVGLLGGIVWNEETGNLVSGHQRVGIIDEVNRYNHETKENDYEIRVDVTHLSMKKEKEQNMLMNNPKVQGDFVSEILRELANDGDAVDFEAAGFDDFDLELYGITPITDEEMNQIVEMGDSTEPVESDWGKERLTENNEHLAGVDQNTASQGENTKIDRSVDFYNDTPENQIARHNEIQKVKDRINAKSDVTNDGGMLSYFIVSFPNPQEKEGVLEQLGYDKNSKFVDGMELMDKIYNIL
jgi:hypothetical protein